MTSNKVLADPVRINIMEALRESELTLTELSEMLHVEKRLLLYHLRVLARARAITEVRQGHAATYVIASRPVSDTSHVLYELWAEEIRRRHSQPSLAL